MLLAKEAQGHWEVSLSDSYDLIASIIGELESFGYDPILHESIEVTNGSSKHFMLVVPFQVKLFQTKTGNMEFVLHGL